MSSEDSNIEETNNVETTQDTTLQKKSRSVNILGYEVPSWVIVLLIVIILLTAYENGMFGCLGNCVGLNLGNAREVELGKGVNIIADGVNNETPEGIKELFKRNNW